MAESLPDKSAETIPVRFDILHAYAEMHRLDYNGLCRMVRDAIAEGPHITQRPAIEVMRQAKEALTDAQNWVHVGYGAVAARTAEKVRAAIANLEAAMKGEK